VPKLSRLSCIGRMRFYYDPVGQVFGDGAIHYLVEVSGLYFLAWEDNDTRTMIVNPITRFDLDELGELGGEEAWMVLHVPATLAEGIQFREIDDAELVDAYLRMEERTLNEVISCPAAVLRAHQHGGDSR
jgi:hypothetical protein